MKPCNQCGKCCINYANGDLSASARDIELWDLFRPDIYSYVLNGEIWMNPHTGKRIDVCPWLKKNTDRKRFTCEIYEDRPEDCRAYPVTISQMCADECEMLEAGDLKNPDQAQRVLDRLMSDSRPPLE